MPDKKLDDVTPPLTTTPKVATKESKESKVKSAESKCKGAKEALDKAVEASHKAHLDYNETVKELASVTAAPE